MTVDTRELQTGSMRIGIALLLGVVSLAWILGSERPASGAELVSEGCGLIGVDGRMDGFYSGATNSWEFFEGDRVTITAGIRRSTDPLPPWVWFLVDGIVVEQIDFPGTIVYTFAVPGMHSIEWDVNVANVMWTVDCEPGQDGSQSVAGHFLQPGTHDSQAEEENSEATNDG